METNSNVIGLDFGTDSVRAVIVECATGRVLGSGFSIYQRWQKRFFCNPVNNQFRQHPLDYIEGMKTSIRHALKTLSQAQVERIVGISAATTGSTIVAVDVDGIPLSLKPEFSENPNAMFILWKDHTSTKEAEEINQKCNQSNVKYNKYVGGIYSPEWFWSKILYTLRQDADIRKSAYTWVEHCDWITGFLTGQTNPTRLFRSRCAAGHKALWNPDWNGLPPESFFLEVDPLLEGLRNRMFEATYTSGSSAGIICRELADELGLPYGTTVGVGSLDAHMGAVGGLIKPHELVKVIGTSTCDMMVVEKNDLNGLCVKGICGQVDGSILPNMIGLEAGQSAFGDIYAWLRDFLTWSLEASNLINNNLSENEIATIKDELLNNLTAQAKESSDQESQILAVDWWNGRRTPYMNHSLKGAIHGLTLSSSPPQVFKSLVEATAFGSKKIVEQFEKEGVTINTIIAVGGIAKKSDFVMQIISDVLNRPVKIAKSDESCAIGAAMAAAVAANEFASIVEAQEAMGSGFQRVFDPIAKNVLKYEKLYNQYKELADFIENGPNLKDYNSKLSYI